MPMLRELFDLCTSKVVQVATLLIEQAPSSVSQTLTDVYKTTTIWTAKPHSPGREAIYSSGLRSK